ncbi:MAG: DarT ssDNA thymidine ADP-ribosyltransferase family protein [Thermodesulfovibrio sp.]|nr:DarT ssDNA thymidine ADP-ribosyltransferase family protein [Thermodesulfovibrio sp.]
MTLNLHPFAKEMELIIKKNNIQALYHFTNIDNLSLIAECNGLWSKERLEKEGLLSRVIRGGNSLSKDLDIYWGNWNKVSLNWGPKMPMMWHIQQQSHLCFFLIKPEVALRKGVVFTDRNATDTNQLRKEGVEGLKLVDFSAVNDPYAYMNTERKKKKQAEILIPDEISLDYVKGVAFISEASRKEGERLWGDKPHPPFIINKTLFHEGFPVVNSAILTSYNISKGNVTLQKFDHENTFKLGQKITLLVSVKSTPGMKTKTIWFGSNEDIIDESIIEFDDENTYWHWSTINAIDMNEGNYNVEYYTGDIRWIRIPFLICKSF